jgi:hypothetical protein
MNPNTPPEYNCIIEINGGGKVPPDFETELELPQGIVSLLPNGTSVYRLNLDFSTRRDILVKILEAMSEVIKITSYVIRFREHVYKTPTYLWNGLYTSRTPQEALKFNSLMEAQAYAVKLLDGSEFIIEKLEE